MHLAACTCSQKRGDADWRANHVAPAECTWQARCVLARCNCMSLSASMTAESGGSSIPKLAPSGSASLGLTFVTWQLRAPGSPARGLLASHPRVTRMVAALRNGRPIAQRGEMAVCEQPCARGCGGGMLAHRAPEVSPVDLESAARVVIHQLVYPGADLEVSVARKAVTASGGHARSWRQRPRSVLQDRSGAVALHRVRLTCRLWYSTKR